jgi:hypothetical protein
MFGFTSLTREFGLGGGGGDRLGEVLDYVWKEWQLAPAKLSALRQHLLCAASGRPAGEVDQLQPLLKVEYFQREDDYLGSSYALGVNSCISLGLPDMPQGT